MADEIKIMIVEPDTATCEAYCAEAAGRSGMSVVFYTGSQTQAIDYFRSHEVNAIIMEIDLEEGDGIGLLDELELDPETKPLIVLATYTASTVTLCYMRMHGVDLVYQKTNRSYSPAYVLQTVEKLHPYRCFAEPVDESETLMQQFRDEMAGYVLRRQVQAELEEMGFRHKMLGFRYLLDAIVLCVDRGEDESRGSGGIYPEIARRWNTTEARVERAMRWAIEQVFVKANIVLLHRHYPFEYDDENGRPSNSEFILNMAGKFEKRNGCQRKVTDSRGK